jgi:hypothetical protein
MPTATERRLACAVGVTKAFLLYKVQNAVEFDRANFCRRALNDERQRRGFSFGIGMP